MRMIFQINKGGIIQRTKNIHQELEWGLPGAEVGKIPEMVCFSFLCPKRRKEFNKERFLNLKFFYFLNSLWRKGSS